MVKALLSEGKDLGVQVPPGFRPGTSCARLIFSLRKTKTSMHREGRGSLGKPGKKKWLGSGPIRDLQTWVQTSAGLVFFSPR
jgi:hypothetical protein